VTREVIAVASAAFLLTLGLTHLARRFALAHGVLDVPNERSSHRTPTPSGGGIAIVASTLAGASALAWSSEIDVALYLALCGGGLVIAAVGFMDDRHPLPAGVRLSAHVVAALWALCCLGGLPPLLLGHAVIQFGWFGYLLGVLGIGWTLNLFNFMDGIDGIAASEGAFIVWGAALIAVLGGHCTGACAMGITVGAACCGFLWWNWPPAKIFMGDVGSGYLGYLIGVLAIADARDNPVALLVWAILGGLFFVDATVTLLRRLLRGERVHQAHRTHAYQWLARRWASHRAATSAVLLVDAAWLLPCAFMANHYPAFAVWIVVGALAPTVLLVVLVGAGRRPVRTPPTTEHS
jgi:Fuc2NAc and GlcNAc transferase